MRKRILTILITNLLLATILIGSFFWLVYREVRQERMNHALIGAIKTDDTKEVIALLNEGADANASDHESESNSYREVIMRCIKKIYHHDRSTSYAPTALCILISREDVASDVEAADIKPKENIRILKALLDHGARVNEKNQNGDSVLKIVVSCHFHASVKLLLEHGADPNIIDVDRRTPLFDADSTSARLLIEHGANIDWRDVDKMTPLLTVCTTGYGDVDLDSIRLALLLIEHGADTNAKDRDNFTPIANAIGKFPSYVVKKMLEKGADPNLEGRFTEENDDMFTPLIVAVNMQDEDALKLLLNFGANANEQTEDGNTALKEACQSPEQISMIHLLKHYGATR